MVEVVHLSVAVLGLDEVGESLGLLDLLGVVVVAVVLGTNVLHLVDATALGASLNGALLGQLQFPNLISLLRILFSCSSTEVYLHRAR